jgi:hypothetical protein
MENSDLLNTFEAIKLACVGVIYSGDLAESSSAERDSCASKIRLLTIKEVVKWVDDKEE